MTPERTLRCYDYVNQPFARVQEALRLDTAGVFARATTSAAEREQELRVQLHVRLGVLDVAKDVCVEVGPPQDTMSSPVGYGITVFPLSWRAVSNAGLFPCMRATLALYPLSRAETQLEFEGTYDPPFGLFGDAIDAMVGHRVAEASALQFLRDVAALLREELAQKFPPAAGAK